MHSNPITAPLGHTPNELEPSIDTASHTHMVEHSSNEFEVVCIPGHCEIDGILIADDLAKQATTNNEIDIVMPVSPTEKKKK